jgi:hypothetical protein
MGGTGSFLGVRDSQQHLQIDQQPCWSGGNSGELGWCCCWQGNKFITYVHGSWPRARFAKLPWTIAYSRGTFNCSHLLLRSSSHVDSLVSVIPLQAGHALAELRIDTLSRSYRMLCKLTSALVLWRWTSFFFFFFLNTVDPVGYKLNQIYLVVLYSFMQN